MIQIRVIFTAYLDDTDDVTNVLFNVETDTNEIQLVSIILGENTSTTIKLSLMTTNDRDFSLAF